MAVQKQESIPESVVPVEKGAVRRRGLIAGAAALAAGVLATRMGNETVDAADGGPVSIGPNTYTAATTTLTGATATVPGFRVVSQGAAFPDTTIDAIQGFATNPPAPPGLVNNSGVHGRNDALGGIGTTGVATNGTGVYGQSSSGSAVGAVSTSGAAVYGQSGSGTGAAGISGTGTGVYGATSASAGYGGYFTTSGNGGTAVAGQIAGGVTGGAAAFVGAAAAPNFAAYFTGNVVVTGTLAIGGPKSAAVNHPLTKDTRLLYCVESPESWFEDFGEGQVVNGAAAVKLDPNFAALVHADSLHVFITEHGAHNGLHTTQKSGAGFTVQADAGLATAKGKNAADVTGTFSWRAVGKRSDIVTERLAKFEMPKITLTAPAKLPTLPKHK